jgi:hypothetical protein
MGKLFLPQKEMNNNLNLKIKKIKNKSPRVFQIEPLEENPNLRLTKTLEMGLWFNPSLELKGEEARQLCFVNSCKASGREECLKKNERVVWQRQQENCGQCYPAPELCLQQDNLKDTNLHCKF